MRNIFLTRAKIDQICALIRKGNYFTIAAAACGVSAQVAVKWMKWGREQRDTIYIIFAEQVELAQAQCEVDLVDEVRGGFFGWQSSLQILHRRFPERWSEQVITTVRNELEDFLDALKDKLPPDQYQNVLRITAERLNVERTPAAQLTIPAEGTGAETDS